MLFFVNTVASEESEVLEQKPSTQELGAKEKSLAHHHSENIDKDIIYDLFFEYERGGNEYFDEYCPDCNEVEYLFIICKILKFKKDNDENEFLKNLQSNPKGLAPLWKIDEIIYEEPEFQLNPHPETFDRTSPAFMYLDILYDLAAKGNVTAIDKLLIMGVTVDGYFAGYWDDKVYDLIKQHPEIIVNNWEIVKKNKSAINLSTTNYGHEADEIISGYQNICPSLIADVSTCQEIISFLISKQQESQDE